MRNYEKYKLKKQPPEATRPGACNFIKKENLAQVFSCEFCEISKNTFLHNTSRRLLLKVKGNLYCLPDL